MSRTILNLNRADSAVFNDGQDHGWNCAKSGADKVNPHGVFSFEHDLFEDGFKLGHKAFLDSKNITP